MTPISPEISPAVNIVRIASSLSIFLSAMADFFKVHSREKNFVLSEECCQPSSVQGC